MWKRWSIKSLTGETSVETKPKQEAITEEAVDQGSLSGALKDAKSNGTMQETILDPQAQPDKVAEDSANPTQLPSSQISADDAVKQSAAPVSFTEISSTEISGSSPIDASLFPEITNPPTTPRTESSGSPFPSLNPSPGGDAPSDSAANVIHTPTVSNTLPVPGPGSNLPTRARRLSFRSFAFFYGRDKQLPSPEFQITEHSKPMIQTQVKLSRAQKDAFSSAITLRALMIGPGSLPPPAEKSIVVRLGKNIFSRSNPSVLPGEPNIKKVKAQLLKPESANAIISYLRSLPLPDGPSFHASGRASSESLVTHPDTGGGPIHAVCLDCTDEEAEKKHFSRLYPGHTLLPPSSLTPDAKPTSSSTSSPNIATASLESIIPVLRDLHLVSLLTSPDLGFGQPVSDDNGFGIFTGSVPSPATLVEGFEEITTQLMNLGFATSKAVAPSHAGIYPPKDRMSVLTYWWGLELVMPEPSVQYLSKVKSISNAVLNVLSALALFSSGVREVLPFIRYIANFVDFEWSAIRTQDQGQGVVCAATWVMPAAMVPRPWDFPSRPKTSPAPTSPSAPETAAGTGDKETEGKNAPMQPPLESPGSSDKLYPVAPALPLTPQLLVTPATLPRNLPAPE